MRVLIVDDDSANRLILRAVLETEGHNVAEAGNGLEALAALEREPMDAIISDILMPAMDGYRLCQELRRSEKFFALPVLLYSGIYTSPGDRALGLSVGADAYLAKPAPTAALLGTLREAIENARLRNGAASPGKDDSGFVLRQYSEVLIRKLEERNAELERAVEALKKSHTQIVNLNERLNQRVYA